MNPPRPVTGRTQAPSPKRDLRVPPPSVWERQKPRLFALALCALISMLFVLSGLAYEHVFDHSVSITLKADRAGLQMHENDRVKIDGADLGRVASVTLDGSGENVDISLALDPLLIRNVPANSTVTLEQLTAFGNKSVQFHAPNHPSRALLSAGEIITVAHVSTEVNNVFDQLMAVLKVLQPSKLNAVLGALANSLQGNGDTLGATITAANGYLGKLNRDLEPLRRDWRSAGGFAEVYAGATDSIADLARNSATVSATLGQEHDNLERLISELGTAGDELADFFGENADPLVRTLKALRPTTSLLHQYAPELTCLVDGSAVTYDNLSKKLWSAGGASFELNFVSPGNTEQYHYPEDLPEVGPGAEKGPNCRGLPVVTPDEDSLADYASGPQSLNQRTEDNSPRLSRPDAITPLPPTSQVPSSNRAPSLARWPTLTPVQRFFGPDVLLPKTPAEKAGK